MVHVSQRNMWGSGWEQIVAPASGPGVGLSRVTASGRSQTRRKLDGGLWSFPQWLCSCLSTAYSTLPLLHYNIAPALSLLLCKTPGRLPIHRRVISERTARVSRARPSHRRLHKNYLKSKVSRNDWLQSAAFPKLSYGGRRSVFMYYTLSASSIVFMLFIILCYRVIAA